MGDNSSRVEAVQRDRNLLRRWRGGDHAAGLQLLEHYVPYFRSLCARYGVHDSDDQVELFQDLSVRILEVLPKLKVRSSFAGYLRRVFITAHRAHRRDSDHHQLPEDVATPMGEEFVEKGDLWRDLFACREGLDEREALVFDGRVLEETAFSVIADEMDLTLGHLYVVYHRVRAKIRECLQGKGYDVDSATS